MAVQVCTCMGQWAHFLFLSLPSSLKWWHCATLLAGLKCMISSDLSAFSLMNILCVSMKRIHNELGEGGILLVSWAVTVLEGEPQYPLSSVVHRGGLIRTEMSPFPYCNPAGMPSSSQLTMTMTSKQQMPALGKWLCQWSAIVQTRLHDCKLPSPT